MFTLKFWTLGCGDTVDITERLFSNLRVFFAFSKKCRQ